MDIGPLLPFTAAVGVSGAGFWGWFLGFAGGGSGGPSSFLGVYLDGGDAIRVVGDMDSPGATADLAVLGIDLIGAAPRVDGDGDGFAAPWAGDIDIGFRQGLEVEVVVVDAAEGFVVVTVAH